MIGAIRTATGTPASRQRAHGGEAALGGGGSWFEPAREPGIERGDRQADVGEAAFGERAEQIADRA